MGAKGRWSVLVLMLVATLAAIAYPSQDDGELVEAVIPHQVRETARAASPVPPGPIELAWVASDEDPFAAREWLPPPPVSPTPSQQPSAPTMVSAPPPPPPPLPYKFVGQMNNDAERTVYLARGEQVMLARQGDVLDGSYKVIAIRAAQIEFEALASGLKETLAIPAQEN